MFQIEPADEHRPPVINLGSIIGDGLRYLQPDSMCLDDMDNGADPRDYLNDEDTLVRRSAASRTGTAVRESDSRVAEAIAA